MNYYNNDYIGATGLYGITDYVDTTVTITSNILNTKIDYTSNILNTKIDYTSNILNTKIDYTSNVLIDYTNELKNELWSVNPNNNNSYLKINLDGFGNSNLYLNNPNGFGKINFLTNHPLFPNANNILTRIDYDNKLYVYFAGSLLPPKLPAWWCVEEQLSAIFDVNTAQDTAIIGLQAELIDLQGNLGYLAGQIQQLQIYTLLDTANTRIALAINSFALAQNVLLGASGISLAVATAALATASYINNNYISLNLYNEITSNNTISSVERSNLLNIVTSNIYTNSLKISTNSSNLNLINGFINCNVSSQQFINNLNTNELNINNININNIFVSSNSLSNLNITHGFINCNIKSQQFINYLKVNKLDVNNGNITNINGVNANEIIASGKIKEYNVSLDNIYLTSNHVYNLGYTYTSERPYPPKLYNTYSVQDTVQLLGKSVFHQIITLNNTGISYGSGIYEIYSSSTYFNYTTKDALFNYNLNDASVAQWDINQYTLGVYNNTNYINASYTGDWVIIKMPQKIMLTKYGMYQDALNPLKAPAEWRVYGSTDGVNFIEIVEARQSTRLTSYTSGFYEKTLASTFTTQYQYFGFTFNKLLSTSGVTNLSFSELKIYGKEIIGNTILSNIYATSNAVKNIVEFSMPVISKHYAFYIAITTPIVINGTTYYKYDVDLRQYTKLGYIDIGSQSGDSYRIFKLRAAYGSMYFSTLVNGLPNVLYSDIFMSMKANPTANLGAAGLNICSIGNINNPRLDTVPPNNLFFMRNGANSIDYITIVSTNPADVRCFIECMIS